MADKDDIKPQILAFAKKVTRNLSERRGQRNARAEWCCVSKSWKHMFPPAGASKSCRRSRLANPISKRKREDTFPSLVPNAIEEVCFGQECVTNPVVSSRRNKSRSYGCRLGVDESSQRHCGISIAA